MSFEVMLCQVFAGQQRRHSLAGAVSNGATVRISVVGLTSAGCGSDRINPIFCGVLSHLGQTRQTAKRKMSPVGGHFWRQWSGLSPGIFPTHARIAAVKGCCGTGGSAD